MSEIGLISELQHFSVGDGDGIRTTVFMQGCNLKCEWCHNPETIDKCGSILLYGGLCNNCGGCESVCPKKAHIFSGGVHRIDRNACNLCGRCTEVCANAAIKISGKQMSVKQVMEYILEDADFYTESGGGVTISGGEPLLQVGYCRAIAREAKENEINVIIDTAGNVPFDRFLELIPYTDTFFFDLKAVSSRALIEKTGGNLDLVLSNLKRLIWEKCDVVVRIPVIPGYNDTRRYFEQCAIILKEIGISRVQLLPFHRLGTAKYKALDKEYTYADMRSLEKKRVAELLEILSICGFDCKME